MKTRSRFSLSQFLGLSSYFSPMHSPFSGFSPWSEVCWSQWKSTMLVRHARIPCWEKGTRFLANSSLHPLSAEADDRIIFYQHADTTHNQHKRSVISLCISSQDCFFLTLSIWYLNFWGVLLSVFSREAEILPFNSHAKFLLTSLELISHSEWNQIAVHDLSWVQEGLQVARDFLFLPLPHISTQP